MKRENATQSHTPSFMFVLKNLQVTWEEFKWWHRWVSKDKGISTPLPGKKHFLVSKRLWDEISPLWALNFPTCTSKGWWWTSCRVPFIPVARLSAWNKTRILFRHISNIVTALTQRVQFLQMRSGWQELPSDWQLSAFSRWGPRPRQQTAIVSNVLPDLSSCSEQGEKSGWLRSIHDFPHCFFKGPPGCGIISPTKTSPRTWLQDWIKGWTTWTMGNPTSEPSVSRLGSGLLYQHSLPVLWRRSWPCTKLTSAEQWSSSTHMTITHQDG